MTVYAKWLIRLLKILGLLALTLNLMIASIPRCSWLSDMLLSTDAAPISTLSCHESNQPDPDTQGAKVQDLRFCACSLLSFTTFALPTLEFDSYIRFKVHTSRELLFWLVIHRAAFIPLPEPPYPKARHN